MTVTQTIGRVNTTPTPITVDPASPSTSNHYRNTVHTTALAALPTLVTRVVYACDQQFPPVTTAGVRRWLDAYGYPTTKEQRPYVSKLVNAWRKARNIGDTGSQLALTPERLVELDEIALRANDYADVESAAPVDVQSPESVAPVDVQPTAVEPSTTETTTPVDVQPTAVPVKAFPRWPLVILALGAFVAVWSGWVGIGRLTGFGLVNLLPGIVDDGGWSTIDTSITLPLGVEAYGAFALAAFLSGRIPQRARTFAGWSALGSLIVGAAGQAAYHLLVSHPQWLTVNADGTLSAPAQIVVAVSCLPVAVLGMGAALAHMVRTPDAR